MEKLRAPTTRTRHYGIAILAIVLGLALAATTWDLSPSYDQSPAEVATSDLARNRIADVQPAADLGEIRWRRVLRVLLPI
jgi:hypothetical protein